MIPNGRETIFLLAGVLLGMWVVPRVLAMVQQKANGQG